MDYIIYRVKKGDSIESISRKFVMETNEFKAVNNLDLPGERLFEGMYVAVEKLSCKKYITQPLETLDMISQKLNIPKERLKELNPKKGDFLFAGEILRIE